MENIRTKIAEIITHTHKTPLEQADEILLLFSVSGRTEQLSDQIKRGVLDPYSPYAKWIKP